MASGEPPPFQAVESTQNFYVEHLQLHGLYVHLSMARV
jgi:hypothetical protein